MVSILDVILSYFLYFLPTLALSSLVVIIGLLIYVLGKRKNLRIMDISIGQIEQKSKNWVTEFQLDEFSTIGRTYRTELQPNLAVKNLRIHFTMVQRHLLMSKIGSLLRRRKDYLLVEADPQDKIVHRYQIEILNRNDEGRIKALVDMLGMLVDISSRNPTIDENFIIRVNDREFFQTIFESNPNLLKIIYSIRENLVRVSLYPLATPSIRIVTELNERTQPSLSLRLLLELVTEITRLGKKGFYMKQQVPRVTKDPTIKEEKPRFPGERRRR
ncbi:MAG: hypothetical protein ACFFE8_06335 [Candidatus Heimdallarchaeota archaeon]